MLNILCYSVVGVELRVCAVFRGCWCCGRCLALRWVGLGGGGAYFETLPKEGRGTFSGILQEGYAIGYRAALAFGTLFGWIGGGTFVLGRPALLTLFVQAGTESPVWLASRRGGGRARLPG